VIQIYSRTGKIRYIFSVRTLKPNWGPILEKYLIRKNTGELCNVHNVTIAFSYIFYTIFSENMTPEAR